MRWWGLVIAGSVSSACVPFALPPGQASIGTATTGAASRRRAEDEEKAPYAMRATLQPLALLDEHQTRTFDFGAGYGVERVARRDGKLLAQGPYLELTALPLRTRTGSFVARGGVRTSADLLVADAGAYRAGYGGSVALVAEVATFGATSFANSGGGGAVAGAAFGEAGVGGFIGVSHRRFQDDSYWVASAGISLRVPAVVGVVCCVVP
jgi:hypothetical protein